MKYIKIAIFIFLIQSCKDNTQKGLHEVDSDYNLIRKILLESVFPASDNKEPLTIFTKIDGQSFIQTINSQIQLDTNEVSTLEDIVERHNISEIIIADSSNIFFSIKLIKHF